MAHRHTILLERTINTLMNTSKTTQDISDVPLGSRVGGASLAQAYRMLALSVQVPSSQNLKEKVAVTPTQTKKYIPCLGKYLKVKHINIYSLYF